MESTMTRLSTLLTITIALLLPMPVALAAPPVRVTSAEPNAAEQDTLNLDVVIAGGGFKPGAKAHFYRTGTSDPGGLVVNSTTYISGKKVSANIDVPIGASIDDYDIEIELKDTRRGKGIELFKVVEKGKGKGEALIAYSPRYRGVMSVDERGGGPREIWATGFGPKWSRDGRFVAFFSGGIKIVDVAAETVASQFSLVQHEEGLEWSDHGGLAAEDQLLAYTSGPDPDLDQCLYGRPTASLNIWVTSFDGATTTQLTTYDLLGPDIRAHAKHAFWLPDGPGSTIRIYYAYFEYDESDPDMDCHSDHIFEEQRVLTLDTTAWPSVAVIDDDPLPGGDPSDGSLLLVWDRQGAQVAWTAYDGRAILGIAVAPVTTDATGHPTVNWAAKVFTAQDASAPWNWPSFSPDGSAVAFTAWDDNWRFPYWHVYAVNTDGTDRRRLSAEKKKASASDPDWGP